MRSAGSARRRAAALVSAGVLLVAAAPAATAGAAGPAPDARAAEQGARAAEQGARAAEQGGRAAEQGGVVETALAVPVGPEPDGEPVTLDASVFTVPGAGPRPAVVLAHGYGGSKDDLAGRARELAGAGYLVLTYTARGFGGSGGRIHLGSPAFEGADVAAVVDVAAARDDVARDPAGTAGAEGADGSDPLVGVAGASYGGEAALLAAGLDPRVDAVAAAITWYDLRGALVPQSATVLSATGGGQALPAPGVLKQGWVAQLLTSSGPGACGRLAEDLCAAYLDTVERGGSAPPAPALLDLLSAAGPAPVLAAAPPGQASGLPVLLVQGESDTLFGLEESLRNAEALERVGAQVSVVWYPGGHDAGNGRDGPGSDELGSRLQGWFDQHLLGGEDGGPAPAAAGPRFEYALPLPGVAALVSGGGSSGAGGGEGSDDDPVPRRRTLAEPPSSVPAGLRPTSAGPGSGVELVLRAPEALRAAGTQQVLSPAGGQPAARTSLPGLGALSALPIPALAAAGVVPGQAAVFESDPLPSDLQVLGASSIDLTVTSTAPDAVLFAALYDVDEAGRAVLPSGLVAPLRVQAPPGTATAVRLALPTVVLDVPAGHRLRLVVATTDSAFAVPVDARGYTVAPVGGGAEAVLALATAPRGAEPLGSGPGGTSLPLPQAVVAGALLAGVSVLALLAWWRGRRRAQGEPATALTGDGVDAPALEVRELTMEYPDGYRALDGVSFTVARGEVVGLLGPNGAGKTTTLRVLLGLLRPTSGQVAVLGQPVTPGAPVLTRVGALVEGPGFLPHLSGRANLELFWEATGRPRGQAHLEEAVAVADLGAALERSVRTYSQGMRMRLGIAQAVLGLPELLVLDEPTNGLDPPQITAMRQVLRDYAAGGRTVLVSSHLLSEVEQTCTQVVVMGRGRVLSAGSVAELVAAPGADGATSLTVSVGPGGAAAALQVLGPLAGVSAEGEGDAQVSLTLAAGVRSSEVVAALVRAGVAVHAVVPRRRLEAVFLELVAQP